MKIQRHDSIESANICIFYFSFPISMIIFLVVRQGQAIQNPNRQSQTVWRFKNSIFSVATTLLTI